MDRLFAFTQNPNNGKQKSFIKNIKLISVGSLVVLLVAITSILLLTNNQTKLKQSGYVSHLNSSGLSLSSSYKVASDSSQNGQLTSGGWLTVSIVLTNHNAQKAKYVTLNTGIPNKLIGYIQNIQGTTGLIRTTPTLIAKNILILPDQTQTLSMDIQSVYSPTNYSFNISPTLIDPSGTTVLRAKPDIIQVAGINVNQVPTQVKTTQGGTQ